MGKQVLLIAQLVCTYQLIAYATPGVCAVPKLWPYTRHLRSGAAYLMDVMQEGLPWMYTVHRCMRNSSIVRRQCHTARVAALRNTSGVDTRAAYYASAERSIYVASRPTQFDVGRHSRCQVFKCTQSSFRVFLHERCIRYATQGCVTQLPLSCLSLGSFLRGRSEGDVCEEGNQSTAEQNAPPLVSRRRHVKLEFCRKRPHLLDTFSS